MTLHRTIQRLRQPRLVAEIARRPPSSGKLGWGGRLMVIAGSAIALWGAILLVVGRLSS